MSAPAFVTRLRSIVGAAEPLLVSLPDEAVRHRPAPDKWSPKEILGHLIDSASNNHQRFVRATWQHDLIFPEYAQDSWVKVQRYQTAAWQELVTLWGAYNRHLSHVMEDIPEAVRTGLHDRHNFDWIAWRSLPATEPATLDYLMADYVAHLEHHLRQILGAEWETVSSHQSSG